MDTQALRTRRFYDEYWPRSLPRPERTDHHVAGLLPGRPIVRALDAGCGTGVCTAALARRSAEVVSLDHSGACVRTARALNGRLECTNIRFTQGDLLRLPFAPESFDLVFCWGVLHHTTRPLVGLDELVRVLRPGGDLILGLYLRTALTPVHEAIRKTCLRLPPVVRRGVVALGGGLVHAVEALGFTRNLRDDNPTARAQVEDWFFVPEKHFFTPDETCGLFRVRGLDFELLVGQTGRLASSSNFIVRGRKTA